MLPNGKPALMVQRVSCKCYLEYLYMLVRQHQAPPHAMPLPRSACAPCEGAAGALSGGGPMRLA